MNAIDIDLCVCVNIYFIKNVPHSASTFYANQTSKIRSSIIGERYQTNAERDSIARNSIHIHIKRLSRQFFFFFFYLILKM